MSATPLRVFFYTGHPGLVGKHLLETNGAVTLTQKEANYLQANPSPDFIDTGRVHEQYEIWTAKEAAALGIGAPKVEKLETVSNDGVAGNDGNVGADGYNDSSAAEGSVSVTSESATESEPEQHNESTDSSTTKAGKKKKGK